MAITDVDPALVQTTANNTTIGMGELETHLGRMQGAATELHSAIKGNTGDAVQQAMSDAFQQGKNLAKDLQLIIDVMKQNGVSFDESDMTEAQKVLAHIGGDGVNSTKNLNLNFQ
ncbi:WXG100 family type VII secretion target [Nocardia vinacea]|uniref:WXG100 family type VII secretion target n=1 Tax=Nocardia vinacea TaxID=96468 RepID=UPI0002F7B356|nr:WXG100 family type VII secretion target [Nocardia vinacea]